MVLRVATRTRTARVFPLSPPVKTVSSPLSRPRAFKTRPTGKPSSSAKPLAARVSTTLSPTRARSYPVFLSLPKSPRLLRSLHKLVTPSSPSPVVTPRTLECLLVSESCRLRGLKLSWSSGLAQLRIFSDLLMLPQSVAFPSSLDTLSATFPCLSKR
jgi:hypothetical protein